MKKLLIICLTVFAVEAYAQNEKPAKSSGDRQAIEQLIRNYGEAINSSDVSKVLDVFTPEGVLMAPGAPTAAGKEQLKGTYEYVFSTIRLNLEFTILEVTVDKDFAIVRSESSGTTTILAENESVPDAYRELFVVQKQNGEWKIARYMYNKSK